MAACKAMLDAAHGVPGSSMVTAMARNGVNFGIRLVGHRRRAGSRRRPIRSTACTSPATRSPTPRPTSATRAITETAGVGGFAMAAAPAIVKFVGGTPADAIAPQPADARDHARRQPVVHAAGARLRRHAPPASTRARWSTAASCRSSTPASRTGRPASGRSAPASPPRRWRASPQRSKALARSVAGEGEAIDEQAARGGRRRRQRADPRRRSTRRSPTSTTRCAPPPRTSPT